MILRDKDKLALKEIFAGTDARFEVWAYGSRVNGTAHPGSDLDLVVINKENKPLPPQLITALKEKIRNSNIPILVEVRDWFTLPEYFHTNINKQKELFFSSEEKAVIS